jgi:soluble lytic murein transglycosylase
MGALRLEPRAAAWYQRGGESVGLANGTARADEVLEWQVRAALRAADWAQVKSTIERMPAALQRDPAWVYWHARALKQMGQAAAAAEAWRALAGQPHFYGVLAAEELGQALALPAPPLAVSAAEISACCATNDGFMRALKLYELGLRQEGNREWNWQLRSAHDGRGMSERELLATAEFARSQNVLDRMISTSERTQTELDFTQRFPAPHRPELTQFATAMNLEPAWVYGLIRQESRFIQDARSTVGATGLMQLMPATARYVARKLRIADFSPARMNELQLNLELGTGYLKMVLNDLDGAPMLATAAYNAGPGRPRAWRASLTQPVEGAVFAETIPFNETRDYVKKVMTNTVYYAALFDAKGGSLKQRLGVVAAKPAGSTDLP